MFLQRLASELSKAPNIDAGLKESEAALRAVTEIKTLEDLEAVSQVRFQTFPFERMNESISLRGFERALVQAKHYQSAELELEEDFV